jgi:predicted deacylase
MSPHRAVTTVTAAVAALLLVLVPTAAARAAQPVPVPDAGAPTARTVDDVARAWRGTAPATVLVGHSVLGRPILARRQGPADAPHVLLVLGQMHGSEPRGRDVVRDVTAMLPPAGVQVWTISTMNPDGAAAGRRTNAHGVDPNRNFPYAWSPRYSSRLYYYPGSAPATEPEVVALMGFLDQLRPDLIVSMHQHYNAVDLGGSAQTWPWARRLSTAMRLRATVVPCNIGTCTGTMTSWYNHNHPGVAITVELPLRVPAALATAYARAILRVGAALTAPTT